MAHPKPEITIVGCGYVGLTTAAILANCGFEVRAIEINPERLKIIQSGRSFFFEAGIDELLAAAFKKKTLTVTDSYEAAIPGSSVVFSCVGTPDNPDGSSNLSYVFDAATQALPLMKDGTIFVQKSTVPVGTGEKIERLFREGGKSIRYVSNPEFLREGTAVSDTLWFDRIVAGSDDSVAAEAIVGVFETMKRHRDEVAALAGVVAPKQIPEPQFIVTARNSAELIKVTANAFLALKISFANSIAKLADEAHADINEVMNGVGTDRRIGRAFLNAGRGYGGGCFPKDVSGLIRSAEEYGVSMEIMHAATEVNDSMPHYIINKAKMAFGTSPANNVFHGKKVAVLGLAFKSGTSDVRRSPAIAIANTLAEQGAEVRAYDPEAMDEARHSLDEDVALTDSLEAAIKDTDCIFVATDWPEFVGMDLAKIAKLARAKVFVDCMDVFDSAKVAAASFAYVGVGKA